MEGWAIDHAPRHDQQKCGYDQMILRKSANPPTRQLHSSGGDSRSHGLGCSGIQRIFPKAVIKWEIRSLPGAPAQYRSTSCAGVVNSEFCVPRNGRGASCCVYLLSSEDMSTVGPVPLTRGPHHAARGNATMRASSRTCFRGPRPATHLHRNVMATSRAQAHEGRPRAAPLEYGVHRAAQAACLGAALSIMVSHVACPGA